MRRHVCKVRPPLSFEVSRNGRYIVDGHTGDPFLLHGYVAWSALVCLNQSDALFLLDDLASKNFNAVIVNLIEYLRTPSPPENFFGDPPFDSIVSGADLDFTDPNDNYWAHVDWFLARMREREVAAWAFPAYYGFIGSNPDQGWGEAGTLAVNGTTRLTTYGEFLGARYASVPGLVWCHYGDALPADKQYVKAIHDGIRSVDSTHLHTAHYARGSLSTDDANVTSDLNLAYCDGASEGAPFPQEKCLDGYAVSPPRPVFIGEDLYDQRETVTLTDRENRANAWQAALSGAIGNFYGNEKVWPFGIVTSNNPGPADWKDHLDDHGCLDRAHVRSFFSAREWWKLVPSTGTGLVTSGGGTLATEAYKSRALAADGSWGAVYVYDGSTVTIDLSLFSATVTARWYDPHAGTYSAVTGGPTFLNSGTHAFVASSEVGTNSDGDADWVLTLEVL